MKTLASGGRLRRILDVLYTACGVLAAACLVGICALMMLLSIGREIGVNVRSGDDITAWLNAAMFALGLAYTFRHGEIVRVGLGIERLTGRARVRAEAACLVVGTASAGALAVFTADMVRDAWAFNDRAQGVLAAPMWIVQLPVAFGMAVLFVAFAEQLLLALCGTKPLYARDPPKTKDEVLARAAEGV